MSDPDGDVIEALAWWDPAQMQDCPVIRPELAANLDQVMAALGSAPDDGKVSPESVNYRAAEDPARCCGTCSMIRPDGDGYVCTLVAGPIDPAAVCDEWDPAGSDVAKAVVTGPKAGKVAKATVDLGNLTGVWADVDRRRGQLLTEHQPAIAAAWDACLASLGSPRTLVRDLRQQAPAAVAKAASPDKSWWKDAATAAALAWLRKLYQAKGYPALLAAIEDAIRAGMAEGEANALALAADQQGKAGFRIGAAFQAAYDRLGGDTAIARQAKDAAEGMVDSTAAGVGREVAGEAEHDEEPSEQDMTAAASRAAAGGTLAGWVGNLLWSAFGRGAQNLYRRAASGGAQVLIDWYSEPTACIICQDNTANGPYQPQDVPAYLAHPNCRCWLASATGLPDSMLAEWLAGDD